MGGRIAIICVVALLAAWAPGLAAPYRAPRTAYGAPDLQGVWTNLTLTSFERPKQFKGLIATDAEAAAWVARRNDRLAGKTPPPDPKETKPAEDPDPLGQATSEFPDRDVSFTRIYGQPRSSILVEPSDGLLPYTPAGRKLADAALASDDKDFSGPEVRISDERCIDSTGSATGPPMIGETQNANYRIVQTRGEIAILSEMIHDVRIVHMGAKHPAQATHPRMGDSIGWWEGDTLVVETVDQNVGSAPRFVGEGLFYISQDAKVTERFTRISPTQIRYGFTVEDPAIYKHTLRGEEMLTATSAPMYEYACHEGNYALANILAGARAAERAAAASAAPAP